MAYGFVPVDRDQQFLLPPDMRLWLPADHPVWFVIDVVESLDLSALEGSYRLGGAGRSPVSPTMLMTLLVWGYSKGTVSSRAIERACREDVAFRVICANCAPDHTTIARFRQRHEKVAEDLFMQVLALCERAGLVRLGTVALDGTKISANAALGANRKVERLRAEVADRFAAAEAADEADDADEASGSGGEVSVPEPFCEPGGRRDRIVALLAEIDEQGSGVEQVNVTDPQSRIMQTADGGRVQGFNAQVVCGAGQIVLAAKVTNEANDYHQLVPMLDELNACCAKAGVSEPVGMVLADSGYFTAANMAVVKLRKVDVLIATTKRHKQPVEVIEVDPVEVEARHAAELAAFDAREAACAEVAVVEIARRVKIFERIEADGGIVRDYLDELGLAPAQASVQLKRWRLGGPEGVTAPQRKGRNPLKKPKGPTLAAVARLEMEKKLAEPHHRERYKLRSHLVETYFGQTKHNRGIDRFARRGLDAVNAEWQLIATVHNIVKLTAS